MAETKKLGERLIEAGLITRAALAQALTLQQSDPGLKLGDCLLKLRLISEQSLLRFLAAEFQTRYVSADKLAKVRIGTEVLERVPVRMAEAQSVLPILYDADRRALSVVMADPQNDAVLEELKIVVGLAQIHTFIGTRAAIQAAIKKHYYSDPTAFDTLADPAPVTTPAEVAAVAAYVESTPAPGSSGSSPALIPDTGPRTQLETVQQAAESGLHFTSPGTGSNSVQRQVDIVHRSSLTSDNDFVETLNVLVGLLEMRRRDAFRAHSAAVAKHARTIAQRMGLPIREVNHVTICAYLHDLGKRPDRHLTLLSASEKADWKADARRYLKMPIKLFEAVHLPREVNSILAQLYEAFDGSGLPQGARGEAIPAGARILAAVDSYEDLTKNVVNVWGRLFDKSEALALLDARSGTLFDPAVTELMRQIHTGELLRERLLANGRQVLVCLGDEGAGTDLCDALVKLGMKAHHTPSSDGVFDAIRDGEVDLWISEVAARPEDALSLTAFLRQEPRTTGLPVILLAPALDATLLDRASGLRPAEVLSTSLAPEKIAERARAMLADRAAAGAPERVVSGMLDEMDLAELLRTLAQARRSGRLEIREPTRAGEILLEQGRVVHVAAGTATGEAAFDHLASLTGGSFTLDPNFLVLDQQMDKDVDVLLRESLQRRKRAAAQGAGPAQGAAATGRRPAASK